MTDGKFRQLFSESQYQLAHRILIKYNTRMNLWDYEVSFERIFNEILSAMDIPMKDIEQDKNHFYLYFRRDCTLFFEVEETLKNFSDKGMCLWTFL